MDVSRIEINFRNAYAQANKLEQIAENMRRIAKRQIANTIQEMSSAWKGESAAAYFTKAEVVKENIVRTADALQSVAERIRREAKRLYEADRAAAELVNTNN